MGTRSASGPYIPMLCASGRAVPTLIGTLDAYLDCGGGDSRPVARKLFVLQTPCANLLKRITDFTGVLSNPTALTHTSLRVPAATGGRHYLDAPLARCDQRS